MHFTLEPIIVGNNAITFSAHPFKKIEINAVFTEFVMVKDFHTYQ